jgi:hypothetical protein
MTFLEALAAGDPIVLIGIDPGPAHSAICTVQLSKETVSVLQAGYPSNQELSNRHALTGRVPKIPQRLTTFLCYETCGAQGAFVGESTFETAAMGGELRRMYRPFVDGTYAFRPSDWRYLLCGQGNARTPMIYAECCKALGRPTGGGSDPYRGTKDRPGPLAGLYEAGKGGNMEHMKDALGVALALTRCLYRTGADPEKYRRSW